MIDFRKKQFLYYDSLSGSPGEVLTHLRRYVADEAREHHGLKDYDLSGWVDVPHPANVPRQNNFDDCGVFTIKFADYLSESRPLQFTANDMPYFRKRAALEICKQRID